MGHCGSRATAIIRGEAWTTMGEGTRLQCGVEFEVLWESQEHMNGR